MVRPEPGEQRLQLRGQHVDLLLGVHHRRRDIRLGRCAGAVPGRVLAALGLRQIAPRARQVLRLGAHLLGVQPGVHPAHHAFARAVGGDLVLAFAHLQPKLRRPVLQPVLRAAHGAEFRSELVADVDVDEPVHDRGGEHLVFGGERDLQHLRRADGAHVQGLLHRKQDGVARRFPAGSGGRGARKPRRARAQDVIRAISEGGRSAGLNAGLANRSSWVATRSMLRRPPSTSASLAIVAAVVGSTRRMLCSSRGLYSLGL